MGVNRISPLTQRVIFWVAISVMRISSPRSVMEMAPAIDIACWHSRTDIVGGRGGKRSRNWRSSSSMMAPRLHGEFFLAGAWKPDISADPALPLDSGGSGDDHLLPRIITGMPPPAISLALSTIPIALWQVPMDIFGFIFSPWGEPSELFLQAKAAEPEGSRGSRDAGSRRPEPWCSSTPARPA